jgi:exodeoxyribonuclease VII small subunit
MVKATLNFSKAFEELESITQWFEAGEVDLEEGLKKFERGLELAKQCREKLAEVENKVKEIKKKFGDETV